MPSPADMCANKNARALRKINKNTKGELKSALGGKTSHHGEDQILDEGLVCVGGLVAYDLDGIPLLVVCVALHNLPERALPQLVHHGVPADLRRQITDVEKATNSLNGGGSGCSCCLSPRGARMHTDTQDTETRKYAHTTCTHTSSQTRSTRGHPRQTRSSPHRHCRSPRARSARLAWSGTALDWLRDGRQSLAYTSDRHRPGPL